MDISDVVSLILSSLALIVSISGVLYSRQRTKIIEKQLKRKERFEEVSRVILKAVKIIKNSARINEFHPVPLSMVSSEVLGYLHDNRLETLEIYMKPRKLELSFLSSSNTYLPQDFQNTNGIFSAVKKENYNVRGAFCDFDFKPNFLSDSELDFGDIFYNIENIYSAYKLLEIYINDIVVFDSTILDDLKQTIDFLLKVIIKSMVSEHKISIDSTDKSAKIYQKLLNEIIDLESIRAILGELSANICDKRLIAIQREIFSKS